MAREVLSKYQRQVSEKISKGPRRGATIQLPIFIGVSVETRDRFPLPASAFGSAVAKESSPLRTRIRWTSRCGDPAGDAAARGRHGSSQGPASLRADAWMVRRRPLFCFERLPDHVDPFRRIRGDGND